MTTPASVPAAHAAQAVQRPSCSLDEAMRIAGPSACLVGPRGSGKTVFAAWLRSATADQPHPWSLAPLWRAATGRIDLHAPGERLVVDPQRPDDDAADPGIRRFDRSRELALLRPTGRRTTGLSFGPAWFDVPGSWAGRGEGRRYQIVERLLRRSACFVLFVPVWALLPRAFLIAQALPILGSEVWATTMAAGPIEAPDPTLLQRAVDTVEVELRAWVDALLGRASVPTHVLVVLSQFQPSVVTHLFDAFASELGSRAVERYEALLRPQPVSGAVALHRLAGRLADVDAVATDMLRAVEARAAELAPDQEGSVCHEIMRLSGRLTGPTHGEQLARKRIRTFSILPLNSLDIDSSTKYTWYGEGRGETIVAPRMGQDVIWWLLLQHHAHQLWRP